MNLIHYHSPNFAVLTDKKGLDG